MQQPTIILRLPTVILRTGLSRSSIYKRISEASFPSPIRVGPRTMGFVEQEVEDWIQARIADSRGTTVQPIRRPSPRLRLK
jgi:prophage regulatory protein